MPAPDPVTEAVAGLKGLNVDQLRQAWRERFGAPPYLRSGDILRRCLAERIQLEAYGGDPDLDRRLAEMARAYNRTGKVQRPRAALKEGTVLLREHGGQTHRVEVLAKGYAWQGRTWASLSRIAQEITGTPWNGPLFFGLRAKAPKP